MVVILSDSYRREWHFWSAIVSSWADTWVEAQVARQGQDHTLAVETKVCGPHPSLSSCTHPFAFAHPHLPHQVSIASCPVHHCTPPRSWQLQHHSDIQSWGQPHPGLSRGWQKVRGWTAQVGRAGIASAQARAVTGQDKDRHRGQEKHDNIPSLQSQLQGGGHHQPQAHHLHPEHRGCVSAALQGTPHVTRIWSVSRSGRSAASWTRK